MMSALAGERVVRESFQAHWTGSEAQVVGLLWAAIYHACCHVMPLDGRGSEVIRCATVIGGTPAVIEVELLPSIELTAITVRFPARSATAAEQAVKEIAEAARRLIAKLDVLVAASTEDDDLPF